MEAPALTCFRGPTRMLAWRMTVAPFTVVAPKPSALTNAWLRSIGTVMAYHTAWTGRVSASPARAALVVKAIAAATNRMDFMAHTLKPGAWMNARSCNVAPASLLGQCRSGMDCVGLGQGIETIPTLGGTPAWA